MTKEPWEFDDKEQSLVYPEGMPTTSAAKIDLSQQDFTASTNFEVLPELGNAVVPFEHYQNLLKRDALLTALEFEGVKYLEIYEKAQKRAAVNS